MTTSYEHPSLVQEFINLGKKYDKVVSELETENARLQEELLDLRTYYRTREEESFPSDVTRRLVIDQEHPVKVFRDYRGLSQSALAQQTGLSQAVISSIENGKRRGTVDNFKALADALNVDVDDLI
ncbi:helix-turn-helix domain-containing protein [Oceanobacter antarcticus]|jgi:ribosome-binding protein aMBF1 (putative translation factor)|uniref:Helix-turn-helix transcriptional regulator n=1 Tax=Oceanobacter antarcticus TaxID=3133425 RepID=A0ABW8NDT3_9GAMM